LLIGNGKTWDRNLAHREYTKDERKEESEEKTDTIKWLCSINLSTVFVEISLFNLYIVRFHDPGIPGIKVGAKVLIPNRKIKNMKNEM